MNTWTLLYFNPYSGEYISTWRYGVNQSLGDWIIWLQVPLHFGTYWGLGVKIVWAVAGLAIPLLAVTGPTDVLESGVCEGNGSICTKAREATSRKC